MPPSPAAKHFRENADLLRPALGHQSYFHRAVMFCVASGMGMESVSHLFNVFRRLDTDKTGRLSLAELEQGLREMGFVAHDARQLLASLDLDQSGFVEYTEFLAGVMSHDR